MVLIVHWTDSLRQEGVTVKEIKIRGQNSKALPEAWSSFADSFLPQWICQIHSINCIKLILLLHDTFACGNSFPPSDDIVLDNNHGQLVKLIDEHGSFKHSEAKKMQNLVPSPN